jgi:hypothetical protein
VDMIRTARMPCDRGKIMERVCEHRQLRLKFVPTGLHNSTISVNGGRRRPPCCALSLRVISSVIASKSDPMAPICSGKPPVEYHSPLASCQHSLKEPAPTRVVTVVLK